MNSFCRQAMMVELRPKVLVWVRPPVLLRVEAMAVAPRWVSCGERHG